MSGASTIVRAIDVLAPGPLTTVQDLGRPGYASLGVGRSGACDRRAFLLANHLVGNPPDAAALEATFGGLHLRAVGDLTVAVTGARAVDEERYRTAIDVPNGHEFRLRAPASGLRTYVAIRGGLAVGPTLSSRSTDLLSGIGPAALAVGQRVPVGPVPGVAPRGSAPVSGEPPAGLVRVRVIAGPRDGWFTTEAWRLLTEQEFRVSPHSNRIAIRLDGPPLRRVQDGELHSEGMTLGAIEVPPSGHPMVLLADHPVTGGYPVIAYVVDDDVDACGQLRPGQSLRFRRVEREWL